MKRVVTAELLDALPASNTLARQSRKDLCRLNKCMGHPSLLARELERLRARMEIRSIVDLGSGDGRFVFEVARRLRKTWATPVNITLVDRTPSVEPEVVKGFKHLGWRLRHDDREALVFLAEPTEEGYTVVLSNLFLHHCSSEALRQIFAAVSGRANAVIALEPRRSGFSLLFSRFVGLIGCNAVTRHDAVASVRAGFNDTELSDHWPAGDGWQLSEGRARPFTHLFAAKRLARK
jgi:hypothetical protein